MAQNMNSGFISAHTIADRVVDLGEEITAYYKPLGGKLLIIGLLKGSFMFMADLVRHVQCPLTIDFMIVQSRGRGKAPADLADRAGWLAVHYAPRNLQGHHVLVVDDIRDSGTTLSHVCNILQKQEPTSLQACILLNRMTDAERLLDGGQLAYPRFIGFNITHPGFVVGYGLDQQEHMRHLPYIMRINQP